MSAVQPVFTSAEKKRNLWDCLPKKQQTPSIYTHTHAKPRGSEIEKNKLGDS